VSFTVLESHADSITDCGVKDTIYIPSSLRIDPPMIPCVWNHQQWINNTLRRKRLCTSCWDQLDASQGVYRSKRIPPRGGKDDLYVTSHMSHH